jgi:hypothetical protein
VGEASGRLGPRLIAGVPLPCPADPRWREGMKTRQCRRSYFGDPHIYEEMRDVPVVRLGRLCVDEDAGELYVLREDGSAGDPLPGARGYAAQVIRERQARRALESIAREE